MAIVAFTFSSMLGTIAALVLWLAFGVPVITALCIYLAVSLGLGLSLIALALWQPPLTGTRLRPA